MKKYDFLIVGAGLFGAIFAKEATRRGKKCLVVERRNHIGGNCYTEKVNGIEVHRYGPHIFHTSDKQVWDYLNRYVSFNRFTNAPMANYKGRLYNLPFNMNTFYQLWGVKTPAEAKERIEEQRKEYAHIEHPRNLEEQALLLGGKDVYETLIKGYSEKQWGMKATQIPAFVIRRLPFRFVFDNNYFNDRYQGIPENGYTDLFRKLLEGSEVRLNTDFLQDKEFYAEMADRIVYTGPIDAYYDYCFGALSYRSLHFEEKFLDHTDNFQGCAIVNYTDAETPYTRIIEHKHFEFGTQPGTVITYEYPRSWVRGSEPYYPVNDEDNDTLYQKYKTLADGEENVIFGGRLAEYRYYDMERVVYNVLRRVKDEFGDEC